MTWRFVFGKSFDLHMSTNGRPMYISGSYGSLKILVRPMATFKLFYIKISLFDNRINSQGSWYCNIEFILLLRLNLMQRMGLQIPRICGYGGNIGLGHKSIFLSFIFSLYIIISLEVFNILSLFTFQFFIKLHDTRNIFLASLYIDNFYIWT